MGSREQLVRFWPLMGLELRTPRLRLAPLCDDDLAELLDVVDAGVHASDRRPFLVPWTLDEPVTRSQNSLKHWWTQRSQVSPQDWTIAFGVRVDDRIVGVQDLQAQKFPAVRHVETGSWLGLAHHGRGIGTEMRAGVLQFVFDTLGAQSAASGAWMDNGTSLRVSEKLGYRANGTGYREREGVRTPEQRLLLEPADFRRPEWTVEVTGFEPCRAQLGL